jgi:hypothetical protein
VSFQSSYAVGVVSFFLLLEKVVAYTKKGDRLVGQIAKRQVVTLTFPFYMTHFIPNDG